MESRPEIAKYVSDGMRAAAVGMTAEAAHGIAGVPFDAVHEGEQSFLSSPLDRIDVLLIRDGALTPRLLAEARARRSEKGVVVVACEVDTSARLLDCAGIPGILATLSEAGFSILSPGRWLSSAERSPLLVVARPDAHTIRSYLPGDETAILELFETSFLTRRAVEWWRWEYADDPYGSHAISLAFDGDGLVAQYAGYPVPLWSTEPWLRELNAHQVGDTMTAVRVRGKGRGTTSVIVRTAKHFFASRCAGKVAFNYGFNTANIRAISTSYNESSQVEAVPFRLAEAGSLRLPGRVSRAASGLLKAYSIASVRSVDGEWDSFLESVAPSYRLLIRRDSRYLKWRYLDHPVLKYEIVELRSRGRLVGWSVFRRQDDTLVWGDALFAPQHAGAASLVLLHALESPVGAGARRVQGWFPNRPGFFSRVLDATGLAIAREPNDLALMCTPFAAADAPARLARDFYYTACDSDLY